MHDVVELDENQLRQLVDAQSLWRSMDAAQKDARQVRGSMLWREMRGVRYLIRTSSKGAQKTLGSDGVETREMYARFHERKQSAQERVRRLKARLEEQRKLNKVYGVGRTPNVVVKVLQALYKAGLDDKFMTIGTHAIYAYETAAGVRVGNEATATRDLDLLFDARKRLAFASTLQRIDASLIGTLKKADPSFRVARDQRQTAVNDDGYEVDIIRRKATGADPHPMRMSADEDDLWAVQIPDGDQIITGRRFDQLVVGVNGEMAFMRTLHPLAFVQVKQQLAGSPARDPQKARKDQRQAEVVRYLWDEYLQRRD